MPPVRLNPAKANQLQLQGNDHVKLFRHYGIDPKPTGIGQLKGNCPFADCGKAAHFFASSATGLWDCKRCGRRGNNLDLIREIHSTWLDFTGDAEYAALSELRPGITYESFVEHRLAFFRPREEWIIPAFNRAGTLTNLYAWRWQEGTDGEYHRQLVATPGHPQLLYRVNRIPIDSVEAPADRPPLWILEGHWDALAWWGVVYGLDRTDDFGAIPGTAFPKADADVLANRDVILVFDNDDAGKQGIKSLGRVLSKTGVLPKTVRAINWGEGLPSGFDVRDLVCDEAFDTWASIMHFVESSIEPVDIMEGIEESREQALQELYTQLSMTHKKLGWQLERLAGHLRKNVR